MNRPLLRLVAGREVGASSFPATTPDLYRAPQPTVHRPLRPAPVAVDVIRRTWHEAHGDLILRDVEPLQAMALASVACISRLEDGDADFVRGIAAGGRLTPATAHRFHALASQLARGGPA